MAQETEWFQEQNSDESRRERAHLRVWVVRVLVAIALLVLVAWATKAYSEAIYEAVDVDVRVVLYNDPCELKVVSNLKHKAIWQEKGKTYQGCWGARPDINHIMFFFDDGSVGLIPVNALSPVRGA